MNLWHITTKAAWEAAQPTSHYRPASLATEGFIHLSTARQWLRTANRFYPGQRDLVRLGIDERLLTDLRFEPADGELFPHLYGALPTRAVTEVHDLLVDAAGRHVGWVPEAHATLAHRALAAAQAEPRVLGLAAAGSWSSGTLDEHSDLDLVLLCGDGQREALFTERQTFLDALGRNLISFTGEHVGEPRLLISLYAAPLLHVDVKLATAADLAGQGDTLAILWQRGTALTDALTGRVPAPGVADWQWVEDRFWVWVHYGASKIARGELFEALDHLGFLRVRALGPLASYTRGNPARGVRFVERDLPHVAERLGATVARLERADLIRALVAALDLYQELRAQAPATLTLRTEAERAARAYLAALTSP